MNRPLCRIWRQPLKSGAYQIVEGVTKMTDEKKINVSEAYLEGARQALKDYNISMNEVVHERGRPIDEFMFNRDVRPSSTSDEDLEKLR